MQRNCKLIVSIIALALFSLGALSQEKVDYKDVLLDGKPAKLNVVTGEITLVSPEVKTKDSTINASDASTDKSDYHIVKKNETLYDIAKKYKVSLTELKRVNNLETTLIDKNQRLRVRNFNTQIDSTIQKDNITTYKSYSEKNNSNFHIVEKDNTLYSLARRYNLSVDKLKSLNNLKSDLIYIGQKLRINELTSIEEENSASVWTVSSGDTLFSIALKNGTTVEAIKQLNGLTSNLIKNRSNIEVKIEKSPLKNKKSYHRFKIDLVI